MGDGLLGAVAAGGIGLLEAGGGLRWLRRVSGAVAGFRGRSGLLGAGGGYLGAGGGLRGRAPTGEPRRGDGAGQRSGAERGCWGIVGA